MKRHILFLIACLCYMQGMAQYGTQFENRGFENWANFSKDDNTNEPVHWHSGMSASGSYTYALSKQIEPSTVVRPGSTGTTSARIWPKIVSFLWINVTANGNMTCGRMNAGSTSASGSSNYNYTQRDDNRFCTPINTVPDSLSVWVCFRSVDANQNARARAMIHGDADFREVADGTFNPADMLVATASATFKRTSQAGGAYTWRRLSAPFVHNGPCNNPKYILFTITTNVTPGEGSGADDMFIDDIMLIYNPSIQMGSINQNSFQIGESLTIPFTLTGTMSPENLNGAANQVIAQLSSANGSFSNPIELGRVTTNTSGSITVTIPSGIFVGEHYRIRLVTTNYPMISNDNGTDITIVGSNTEIAENDINLEASDVEIFDITGHQLTNKDLAPGIYVVRYKTKKGFKAKKFLKR